MERLPFDGIKILDFTWMGVGPFTINHLTYFGATAIKVESSSRPDPLRYAPPPKDGVPGLERSYYFAYTHPAESYAITLNLNHATGREIARKLVAWADIVAESFTAGTMEKWGLGYADLKRIKPDIIMLRTCMHGQTGPLAKHPGQGFVLTALSGLDAITGWPDRPASPLYGAFTDFTAPLFGAIAMIAALDYRRRTGIGQCLDLSQHEASIHCLGPLILDYAVNGRQPARDGNRRDDAAPCGIFKCQGTDRWCAISVSSDAAWEQFCNVLGNPAWTQEPRFRDLQSRKQNEDDLERLVEEWTKEHTAEEVMALLQNAGVAAGVASNIEDLTRDPQLNHYQCFQELDHPEMGKMSLYHPPGFTLSDAKHKRNRAPLLGEHNKYVYTELLGFSEDEFVQLAQDGVIN